MNLLWAACLALLQAAVETSPPELVVGAPPPTAGELRAPPEYPLGRLRFPSLTTSTTPVTLADLRYGFSQSGGTSQFFEARFRLGTFAYVGGQVSGNFKSVFFDTHRTELFFSEDSDRYEIEAAYRAPRWVLRANGRRRPPGEGESWILRADGFFRINPDLEVQATFLDDDDKTSPFGFITRTTRMGRLGVTYQRGTHFDLSGSVTQRRILTSADFELDRTGLTGLVTFYRASTQLDGEFTYETTSGRLPRGQGFTAIALTQRFAGHFVFFGNTANRWEPGVKLFRRNARGGVTFFGRRYRFERGGDAAGVTDALTRHAWELGYSERRVYDVDARRALRERLALSPRRAELRSEIDALYRAEVEERNVAQAGFLLEYDDDDTQGRHTWDYTLFIAIPWRPAFPFHRSESAVDFVGVQYYQQEDRYSSGFESKSKQVSVQVAFNREMTLNFTWDDPGLTPLDVALFRSRSRSIGLDFVYAFGR